MTARKIWIVLAGALWLCLLGVIASVAVERLRVDHHRTAAHFDETGGVGTQLAVRAEWPWEAPVRVVSEALARGDRASAEWAWRNAWGAALGARRWEGMAAVGALAVRMGESPRAREAFLVALFRARDQRSFTGVLKAEEAFETLGDRMVALQCLHVASAMPGIGDLERGVVRERFDRLAVSPQASWEQKPSR
jgi:hypothetical protein